MQTEPILDDDATFCQHDDAWWSTDAPCGSCGEADKTTSNGIGELAAGDNLIAQQR